MNHFRQFLFLFLVLAGMASCKNSGNAAATSRSLTDNAAPLPKKQRPVLRGWEEVILNYLQPNDVLKKELHVEIRNDNGPQFSAKSIRQFLKENHLHQVFTPPYTPQENGHVESFHHILSTSLKKQAFWSLADLETRLEQFYHTYNHVRLHGSTARLAPAVFWECWNQNLIERIEIEKKKVRFRLKVPYQNLSGNKSLEGVLCLSGYTNNTKRKTEERGPRLQN